jgi:hypothetical protein
MFYWCSGISFVFDFSISLKALKKRITVLFGNAFIASFELASEEKNIPPPTTILAKTITIECSITDFFRVCSFFIKSMIFCSEDFTSDFISLLALFMYSLTGAVSV